MALMDSFRPVEERIVEKLCNYNNKMAFARTRLEKSHILMT